MMGTDVTESDLAAGVALKESIVWVTDRNGNDHLLYRVQGK
jgi:hypothetical protein